MLIVGGSNNIEVTLSVARLILATWLLNLKLHEARMLIG
jgi:hypothetical protein